MRKDERMRLDRIFLPWERGEILETIAVAEGNQSGLKELLNETGLPLELAQYHLDYFVQVGILEDEMVEREKIYRMCVEDADVRLLKELFDAWNNR